MLAKPCYVGCPLGRLPLMPIERNSRTMVLFVILFAYILFTQLVVIQPKLDVWYFMLSTSMISAKLLLSFLLVVRANPGYVEKEAGPDFEFKELLKKVPSKHLCPYCKVIKPERAEHCHICNKCVDRYEGHCTWLNNCVGRKNSNMYMVWIFYVWLEVFLLGWIAMDSIVVTKCEIDHCVYAALCLYCNWLPVHYLVTVGDMIICFFYFFPSGYLCWMQFMNYGRGETTYERFSRNNRTASSGSELDTQSLTGS